MLVRITLLLLLYIVRVTPGLELKGAELTQCIFLKGQKSVKNLGSFLGNGVSRKIAFEIY